jgi:hypothetical protein
MDLQEVFSQYHFHDIQKIMKSFLTTSDAACQEDTHFWYARQEGGFGWTGESLLDTF